jgi:hypothetical protein
MSELNNVESIHQSTAITDLMNLVGQIRRGDVIGLTVVTTSADGEVKSKRLVSIYDNQRTKRNGRH